ncbi:MAG TPA: sorbosone dehydrogenase family protein [Vicinamibacterales bacterium]|nr:sorbosone dehydrogenase family protein [Vicinamibacterales bacterium]HWI20714.1 sorbosone dehydrogenase family protein [Vicinamibacterales bacterium]
MTRLIAVAGLACVVSVAAPSTYMPAAQEKTLPLDQIKLPPGFSIAVYSADVPNARQMALGDKGTLFVGSRNARRVYAVVDADGDQKADRVHVIATGLNMPSGIAFRNGSLYVAEVSRVIRYDDIEAKLESPPEPVVVNDQFPTERAHGWKYLGFGPDGWLYVPVGAPCNICERPDDERFATITRMKPDGSGLEIFARGIRNTVGFDWHPRTRELWIADNGRDMMGDDVPPDELLRAHKPGLHFGFPYCHGDDIPDPEFGSKRKCSEFERPALNLGAHVAAIGMKFYTGRMFPEEYRNQIFVAEHGSWNRSQPQGYRVMLIKLDGNKPVSYTPFAEGWLRGIRQSSPRGAVGDAWGRPADVFVMPDGALLVSDDEAGVIYRVSYKG